ncbi:MAG: hypothetical protein ACO1N5_12670, partial [Noviherbaspirillum sp.]
MVNAAWFAGNALLIRRMRQSRANRGALSDHPAGCLGPGMPGKGNRPDDRIELLDCSAFPANHAALTMPIRRGQASGRNLSDARQADCPDSL